MSVLWKCCLRALKENKSRTIVTILGVALATALITAVSCTLTSTLESAILFVKRDGDWHGRFVDVGQENLKYFQENQSLEGVWFAKKLGYAYANDADEVALKLMAPQEGFAKHLNLKLVEGRWPQKEGEILLGNDLRLDGKKVKIGDAVTLSIGEDALNDKDYEDRYVNSIKVREEKTYVVVGLIKKSKHDGYDLYIRKNGQGCDCYDAYAYDDGRSDVKYDVLIRYQKSALKNFAEVNQALLDISPEVYRAVYKSMLSNSLKRASDEQLALAHKRAGDFQFHELLAVLEAAPNVLIKETDYTLLFMVIITAGTIVFLLIILAGAFCIDNSFDVSFMERIRFYGMLASVGTTKRQKRGIVWMEAFVIGVLGIPFGILMGILFTLGLVGIINVSIAAYLKKLEITLVLGVAWWGILLSVLLSMFMVCLSAMGSAVHASKIMPIEAIRNNEEVKAGKKKKSIRTPKLIKRVFGIGGAVAWQNFRRSRIKYRATITSIAISTALFLGMSFLAPLFRGFEEEVADWTRWDVTAYVSSEYREILEFAKNDPLVTESQVSCRRLMISEEGTLPYDENLYWVGNGTSFYLIALDEKCFEDYCNKIGVSAQDARYLGIAQAAKYETTRDENGVEVKVPRRFASFAAGDVVGGETYQAPSVQTEEPAETISVTIFCQTDLIPEGEQDNENVIRIYVSESFAMKNYDFFEKGVIRVNFKSSDAYALEEKLGEMGISGSYLINYTEEHDIVRFGESLVIILLVSFIVVIVLIGVTNVINAVSTNMELRSPEFAKLRAIGMTKKQFRAMLWTEGFFIGGKGLLFGIPIGYFISYALYRYYWEASDKTFQFGLGIPILQTILVVIAVGLTLMAVLHFGRKKFEKKNLIETIRSENM